MVIDRNEDGAAVAQPVRGNARNTKRRRDRLPPELEPWQRGLRVGSDIAALVSVLFVVTQLSLTPISVFGAELSSTGLTYVASGVAILAFILSQYLRYDQLGHDARLEDRSQVEAKIAEAYAIEPWLGGPRSDDEYKSEHAHLVGVVRDLEKLGQESWTEFQVLPLDKALVDLLEVNPLKARAITTLAYLEEYGEDKATRYDERQYERWKNLIEGGIKEIENMDMDSSKSHEINNLKANLKELFEEIAHYDADWATGKVILRILIICGIVAMVSLFVMGLLPILHPLGEKKFAILNWGVFGSVGALIAVFQEIRKSNLVELGNTDATREVLRAFIGAALGLVAGVIVYSLVGGMIFEGKIFPIIDDTSLINVSLSILVGLSSGYSFERVFDRMKTASDSGV